MVNSAPTSGQLACLAPAPSFTNGTVAVKEELPPGITLTDYCLFGCGGRKSPKAGEFRAPPPPLPLIIVSC